jgi:hypothetical protein
VVYDWIAAVRGLRAIDMAWGGLRPNVLAQSAAAVGVDANPEGPRARSHALPLENCASSAAAIETF